MRKLYLLFVLTVFLAGFAYSVFRMERTLAGGTDMLLELTPVDPRALLMGDYMDLDYAANWAIYRNMRPNGGIWPDSGRAVMRSQPLEGPDAAADAPPKAVFVRLDDGAPLGRGEFFLAFKTRGDHVITAAPAFYFQEGDARAYARALYGRIKIDASGATLLAALCDARGKDIVPEPQPDF